MRSARIIAALMMAALVAGQVTLAQEKVQSKITVLVPERGHAETILTISNQPTEQTGTERKFLTPSLEKGAQYTYTFQAIIEPNNYTKITRTKSVTFKAGDDVKVDLTVKDEKNDKIVVRWVPTPDDIVDKMSEMAKVTKDDVIWDLGCGDAVMLVRPILKYKAKKGVGVDIDPKMIEIAKKYAKEKGVSDRVELRVGDILDAKQMPDLKNATVVLLYIGDDLGERLGPVLQANLKPGARVVSHRFSLGDWEPTRKETVTGEDGADYDLLLWIVPEKKK
jgi:uncharacterized protein (TIGR03000 family)